MIKKIKNKLSELPLSRQILLVTAMFAIWTLLYKFWFLNYRQLFTGAFELGEITYTIASSVIASSIFYYIVIYRPLKQRQKFVIKAINQHMLVFKLHYILMKRGVYEIQNLKVPEDIPLDYQEFIKICQGILLTDKPPSVYPNLPDNLKNWFEYFDWFFSHEEKTVRFLQNYWEYLPVEVKFVLEDLQTNTLHTALSQYKITKQYNNLSNLGGPFWSHLNILKSIPEIIEKKMKV